MDDKEVRNHQVEAQNGHDWMPVCVHEEEKTLTVNNWQQGHLNFFLIIAQEAGPILFNPCHYKTLRRAERDTDALSDWFS